MTAEQFILTTTRDGDGRVETYRIESKAPNGQSTFVTCNGNRAPLIATSVHELLQRAKVSAVQRAGSQQIDLETRLGAQVALLLSAVKPLRRIDRIEHVATGIASMTREEAAYWYAKSHLPSGLAALRVLLAAQARRR